MGLDPGIRGGAIPYKCFRGNGGAALPLNAFVGLGPVGKPTAFPFQTLSWGWPLETGAAFPVNVFVGRVLWELERRFAFNNAFVGLGPVGQPDCFSF